MLVGVKNYMSMGQLIFYIYSNLFILEPAGPRPLLVPSGSVFDCISIKELQVFMDNKLPMSQQSTTQT